MTSSLVETDFNFFMPLVKATTKDDGKVRVIEGIASTSDKDLQGEELLTHGIDTSYFEKWGYFNWDHKKGAENKIGEPWVCKIIPKGLYVKGMLYKGKAIADSVWEHMLALANNPEAKRKMGFSLQGKTLRRFGNKVLKAWVQDIAITTAPINFNTYADIVKSLGADSWCKHTEVAECLHCAGCMKSLSAGYATSGQTGGSALRVEDLDDDEKVTTFGSEKRHTKKSLSDLVMSRAGYSRQSADLLADILFDLAPRS